MASIRDTVAKAFRAKVATITKANGYSEDLGARVLDFGAVPAQSPTPCAIIAEGTEEVAERSIGRYERTLNVAVGFVVSYSGPLPQEKARECFADIQGACGSEFTVSVPLAAGGTGSITVEVRERSSTPFYGQSIPGRVGGQVDFLLIYSTTRTDPREH